MKKKEYKDTIIGFANEGRVDKDIKWIKNGLMITSIGLFITTLNVDKYFKDCRWYRGGDDVTAKTITELGINFKNSTKK